MVCWMGVNILWYNILTPPPFDDRLETVGLLSLGKTVILYHGCQLELVFSGVLDGGGGQYIML